jgi:hypothetical protein
MDGSAAGIEAAAEEESIQRGDAENAEISRSF